CTQTIHFGTPSNALTSQISDLLAASDLVVGIDGERSLRIPGGSRAKASASCLAARLSMDGAPEALPDSDIRLDPVTCQTSVALTLRADGTWTNSLLSQAI